MTEVGLLIQANQRLGLLESACGLVEQCRDSGALDREFEPVA